MAADKKIGRGFALGLAISIASGGLIAWATNLMLAKQLAPGEDVELAEYVPPEPSDGAGSELLTLGGPNGEAAGPGNGLASAGLVPREGGKTPYESYRYPILNRNIFDSSVVGKLSAAPIVDDTGEGGEDGEGGESEPREEKLAPLCVYVDHTMKASPMRYSWALIAKDDRGADQTLFTVGEQIFDDEGSSLVSVGLRDVTIRRRDGSDTTYIIGEDCPEGAKAPEVTASVEAPKKVDSSGGLGSGIEKVGDNKFIIAEAEINKAMSNLEELQKAARVVPHYQNGEIVGYKVFRIKANSVITKLGLKNGDILERVNGESLKDPSKLMGLYSSMKQNKSFQLDIQRRNQPVTLSYDIR